ncbi:hypothetical protein THAOC_33719, partial [Thalassiosira oceanica]
MAGHVRLLASGGSEFVGRRMNAFARPNLSRLQTKQYAIRLALDAQIIIKMKRSDADLHLMTESLSFELRGYNDTRINAAAGGTVAMIMQAAAESRGLIQCSVVLLSNSPYRPSSREEGSSSRGIFILVGCGMGLSEKEGRPLVELSFEALSPAPPAGHRTRRPPGAAPAAR